MADIGTVIKITADVVQALGGLRQVNSSMQNLGTVAGNMSTSMRSQGKSLENIGNSLYTFGRRMNSAIAEPLKKFGEEALKTGADMVAFDNRYKLTLGSMAKSGEEWATKTGEAISMTTKQVEAEVVQFDILAKAIGKPAKEALHFSEKMTNLTNDLATFYNVDPEVATQALAGMLKGRYRAVASLGIIINSTTMAEELSREGIKKKVKDLTVAQKATLAYNIAMQQTKGALGQAEKQHGNYRAEMLKLKGTMDDLYEKVFVAMQPVISKIVDKIGVLVDWFSKLNPKTTEWIVKIGMLLVVLAPVLMYLGLLITGIAKVWGAIGKLVGIFGKLSTFMSETLVPALEAGFTAIGTAFTALAGIIGISVGWLIVIIAGIAVAIFLIVKYHKQVWAFLQQLWAVICKFFRGVWDGMVKELHDFSTSWNNFLKGLSKVWHSIADPLWTAIKFSIKGLKIIWDGVWDGATKTFNRFVSGIKNIWSGIKSFFKMPKITMSGSLNPAEMMKGNLPHLGVSWNASGGIFDKASVIGVGEDGSEAVIPLSNTSKVRPFAQAVASLMPQADGSKLGHSTSDVVIKIDSLVVREEADIDKIAQKLFKLQEKNRRARGVMANV